MDTSSIIIGVFFLVLFMAPLIFIILKQKKFQHKYQQKLKEVAKTNSLNLTSTEINYWSFLGFDQVKKVLLLGDTYHPEHIEQLSLSEIHHSQLIAPGKKTSEIKEIKVKLSGHFGVKEIVFYKDEDNISADAAVYLNTAKKWLGTIQKA
ncbi:hypothetical protein [Mesonia aestuariivivens]|uniref:Uncharacterized protein n=1 Tax=Mesonia aestuariivivens TaxID=2796128 RepID=A0ABS6W1C2_9FLAO|nr:hypothetical protein [Mesonia aestuariivivens]MBW2961658.1 hypothetical protein [Mesonia aestuariivivens]